MGTLASEIKQVVATVSLAEHNSVPPTAFKDAFADPNHLYLRVALSAVLSDGTTIATGPHLGIGGPRRGIGAMWCRYHGPPLPEDEDERIHLLRDYCVGREDIEDAINEHLARDPTFRACRCPVGRTSSRRSATRGDPRTSPHS